MYNDLNEYRKALKKIGFNVKTKTLSFGVHATYKHIETNHDWTFDVFDTETLNKFNPLFNFIKENEKAILELKQKTNIIGLLRK
jgi:hypothetical protein